MAGRSIRPAFTPTKNSHSGANAINPGGLEAEPPTPKSLLPIRPPDDVLAGAVIGASSAVFAAALRPQTWPPHAAQIAPQCAHPETRERSPCNRPACCASAASQSAECGCPARWCCPDSPSVPAAGKTPSPGPCAACAQTRYRCPLLEPQRAG